MGETIEAIVESGQKVSTWGLAEQVGKQGRDGPADSGKSRERREEGEIIGRKGGALAEQERQSFQFGQAVSRNRREGQYSKPASALESYHKTINSPP